MLEGGVQLEVGFRAIRLVLSPKLLPLVASALAHCRCCGLRRWHRDVGGAVDHHFFRLAGGAIRLGSRNRSGARL